MMILENDKARGRESALGAAINLAHETQKQHRVVLYIYEDQFDRLRVQNDAPAAGPTYLRVNLDGSVNFIPGLDSMRGENWREVLDYCEKTFR